MPYHWLLYKLNEVLLYRVVIQWMLINFAFDYAGG